MDEMRQKPMDEMPGPQTARPQQGEPASPEEQEQYNLFVGNAVKAIFDERVMPTLLDQMTGGGDPVDGLANALVMVVMHLESSMKQNGIEMPDDVKLHGGLEILENLVELAAEGGVHEYTPAEAEGAFYKALDLHRENRMQSGDIDDQKMTQAFAEILEMDRKGELSQAVPGLEEHVNGAEFGKAPGGEEKPMPEGEPPKRGMMRRA